MKKLILSSILNIETFYDDFFILCFICLIKIYTIINYFFINNII